jgi:hypothetical protein
MLDEKRYENSSVLVPGVLGTIGALLILAADIVYNIYGGKEVGKGLYISTYFGVFLFPLWWEGIFVIYQGLKPAGRMWSLYPCLIFAFLVSTVNVLLHSSYPYFAVMHEVQGTATSSTFEVLQRAESMMRGYVKPIYFAQSIIELIIAVWITIPILTGKSLFPRWMAVLIPIYPMAGLFLLGLLIPDLFKAGEPFIASGSMCLVFLAATKVVHNRFQITRYRMYEKEA